MQWVLRRWLLVCKVLYSRFCIHCGQICKSWVLFMIHEVGCEAKGGILSVYAAPMLLYICDCKEKILKLHTVQLSAQQGPQLFQMKSKHSWHWWHFCDMLSTVCYLYNPSIHFKYICRFLLVYQIWGIVGDFCCSHPFSSLPSVTRMLLSGQCCLRKSFSLKSSISVDCICLDVQPCAPCP